MEDADDSEELASELEKVRKTLRGNLVPEARKLVEGNVDLNALLRAPLIWILSCGNHAAYASLGAALQRTGYRVKVFGVGAAAGIFAKAGLPFEALDWHVPLHRHNEKAREYLQEGAKSLEHLPPGVDKEEEFLLELHILRHEFLALNTILLTLEDLPQAEKEMKFAREQKLHETRFNDFFLRAEVGSNTSLYHLERLGQCIFWRSCERRVSVENYAPIRMARSLAFRTFLGQLAEEVGSDRITVLECLRNEFSKYFFPKLAKVIEEQKDAKEFDKLLQRELNDFMLWQTGESPREWWGRWEKKMPAWKEGLAEARIAKGLVPVAMHNMLLTTDGVLPQHRPQLVLYEMDLVSVALTLEAQYQLSVAMASPWYMPSHRASQLNMYNALALGECVEPLPFMPMRDLGPMAFSEMLRGSRQLCGAPPLVLKDEILPMELRSTPVELQQIRACCTGAWVCDGSDGCPQLLPPDDPLLFGSPGERDSVIDFLAASSEPPVCLYWGRHVHPSGPEEMVLFVAKTLKLVGRRGIFVRGKSGAHFELLRSRAEGRAGDAELRELVEYAERHILFVAVAPHSWLFPRCACVVHGGGNGTTQAALRAGVPQAVVASHGSVEPYGTGRLAQLLGCGVEGLSLQYSKPPAVAEKLRSVLGDASMKAKAAEVAATLRKEPGVVGAVALVSNLLLPLPPQEPLPKQACPWPDGAYAVTVGGQPVFQHLVRGLALYRPDGGQVGWMKLGSFRHENAKGLPKGHTAYTIMVMWVEMSHVGYGTVSSDGKRITWDDGNYHEWLGAAPPAASQDESAPLTRFLGGIVGQFTRQVSPASTKNA